MVVQTKNHIERKSNALCMLPTINIWLSTLRLRQNGHHFVHDIFSCIFLNENFRISKNVFIEMCFLGSNWQYVIIGSDKGWAPNRRQAIIWTSDGLVYWCIYASLGLNELIWREILRAFNVAVFNVCSEINQSPEGLVYFSSGTWLAMHIYRQCFSKVCWHFLVINEVWTA